VGGLLFIAQHAREDGLAGKVHAIVGQHGHDARRRHGCEAWLVDHAHEFSALGLAQGMAGRRAHRRRPAQRRCLGQGAVLAQQLALEFLDALAISPRGLRAGSQLLRRGQRGRGVCAPLGQLLRVRTVRATPRALGILAPALQGARANPNFSRNHVDHCALRRQQPRHRSVFECLSVSSQVCPSSAPRG
jgi:hypothetical protein